MEKENNVQIKKFIGQFSIDKFTRFDIRSLSYHSHLVIDFAAIDEDLDVIIENLIAINTLYDMRIILFAEDLETEDIERLVAETKIQNIITERDIENIRREMQLCISPTGMTRDYLNSKLSSFYGYEFLNSSYIFTKMTKIIVAGAMERIGTTTTALNVASYLKNVGAKVSYTEANDSGHLKDIQKVYYPNSVIKDKTFFFADDIYYFYHYNIPSGDYDFNIVDLGILTDANKSIFNTAGSAKILCSGIRPYELSSTKKSIDMLRDIKDDYNLLVPDDESLKINNYIPNHDNYSLHRPSRVKGLFDCESNKDIWKVVLSDYIVKAG